MLHQNVALKSLASLALLLPSLTAAATLQVASPERPFILAERTAGSYPSSSSNSTSASLGAFPHGLHFGVDYYPEAWVDPGELDKKATDTQRQKEAGLQYVRIGEFMWKNIEPQDGVYNFTLLDQAIEDIGSKGMKVILGTPTATPPRWASLKYDILPQDSMHFDRIHGSRRHYSFSSPDYQMLSKRITKKLAERYGDNPHVGAIQLDNEFGCHSTVRTYDKHAKGAFQKWLQNKYGDVETMNRLQGNTFWSQAYDAFDEVDVPTQEVTESNPALRLDFFEFSSDQVIAFAKDQADIWRKYRKHNAPISTNFMGFFVDFDHHKFAKEVGLELATFDSYPLGNTEQFDWVPTADKVKYGRQGRPDAQSFHFELYKGVAGMGKGQATGDWGVMELQPGAVNWAQYNPIPLKGMVRLWLHEIFAHGGSLAAIFRWREAFYGEEQMHEAMYRRDNTQNQAYIEQQEVATKDLPALIQAGLLSEVQGETGTVTTWSAETPKTKVAFVHDYYSQFVLESNPQGGIWSTNTFNSVPFVWHEINGNFYSALRRLGLAVDVISPDTDLSAYDLVVVPAMAHISDAFEKHLNAYKGSIVFGPRSASKVDTLSIPDGLPPSAGAVRDRLPISVNRVESLRPDLADKVSFGGKEYPVKSWAEWVRCARNGTNTSMPVEATFSSYRDGEPATCAHKTEDGKVSRYVAYYADANFLTAYLGKVASEAGIKDVWGNTVSSSSDLGEDLRFSRQGNAVFAFNYGPSAVDVPSSVPSSASVIVGDAKSVAAAGVAVWKLS
ncbi:glycoside hydrolase family 42 protein [Tilletiaria anomala UBC 951]|uniref:beta-galactosidase n=1 Tax=Tilletiaria anomala (strain ATCC 24038 / CBS 436.72 / UBC 951) TaxID=1037660 RepID=A0A066WIT7_TILAU|nr:glycoside hydrolase family 42 protein [Tilletiaria anomala UBC 951]KDN52458.1 glycoside hydrolase family 42 protein [Tilletiaria anomala UBC 951]